MKLRIPHRNPSTPDQHAANWRVLEQWTDGRINVIPFSFPGALAVSTSPGFVAPNPLQIIAFHLFLITAGTATSTFDLLKNGTTVLSAVVSMASTVRWARVLLPRPTQLTSVQDVIASRASIPDYLQAKIATAGATAADLYCGAEYQS